MKKIAVFLLLENLLRLNLIICYFDLERQGIVQVSKKRDCICDGF